MNTVVQSNLALLERLETLLPNDLDSAQDLLADTFVWHYFNPVVPDLAGDYEGVQGLQTFFKKLAIMTDNTFTVTINRVIPVGEELVVVHANPSMAFLGHAFELDAVVVWRIVDDRIAEAWDIPSVYTVRLPDDYSSQLQEAA